MSDLTPASTTPPGGRELADVRLRLLSAQAMITLVVCLLGLCAITLATRPVDSRLFTPRETRYQVDVNQEDARMLSLLPGIGPGLAAQIVTHRETHGPFADDQALLAVPRIGPLTLERIRPYLRVAVTSEAD